MYTKAWASLHPAQKALVKFFSIGLKPLFLKPFFFFFVGSKMELANSKLLII